MHNMSGWFVGREDVVNDVHLNVRIGATEIGSHGNSNGESTNVSAVCGARVATAHLLLPVTMETFKSLYELFNISHVTVMLAAWLRAIVYLDKLQCLSELFGH